MCIRDRDVHDKYEVIANSLTSVKNELRGEINKNISSINDRVIVTRDFYNEIELENFSHENRVIHPMRFLNQTRDYNYFSSSSWEVKLNKIIKCFKGNSCLLYTSRCV